MSKAWLQVALLAVGGAALGILVRQEEPDPSDAFFWSVLSFSSLGACLGCLLNAPSDGEPWM